MPRTIDPSELEGDELATWYRRSPADVEAEREAARQAQYDAFVNSIGAAPKPQDDSGVGPRERSFVTVRGSFDQGDAGLIKARFPQPPTPPAMRPPSGLRVGPPMDAQGGPPLGAATSGFFGGRDYSSMLGGYLTDLPKPLNAVTGTPSGWWELGDGSRVKTGEVERIYAEQRRRLKGQDDVEPAPRVRVVDKWKDGQIPRADQLEKAERELDPTCAPYGGWERDPGFDSYSDHAKRYETQVTRAPGLDYVVRNPSQRPVKFDGCAVWDPQHPLLEAKGPGYAALLPKADEWGFYDEMFGGAAGQSNRQFNAAPNQRIEWHIAEPGAFDFFAKATDGRRPPISLQRTPAR